ncbi:hypothetical protein GCM10011390_02090 [Aureimonas endophytica]|uniref:Uncharacterized protein n=1 Tax=Aureimonas endophytica TaxID=2027858 RepID=A0A916ZBR1_9HYPH|nr:hypothetical protein [Aureimonas endophytica]GGD87037.1 hypothetical protein GCM10011390_02090 [Aureimonas endophytica]
MRFVPCLLLTGLAILAGCESPDLLHRRAHAYRTVMRVAAPTVPAAEPEGTARPAPAAAIGRKTPLPSSTSDELRLGSAGRVVLPAIEAPPVIDVAPGRDVLRREE